MIGRIHERASFERIAREGTRVRAGVLWCSFVLDPLVSPPRVAYAIGRAAGPAVTRNRIRRRLRALLAMQRSVRNGLYLIGVQPTAGGRSFTELTFDLTLLFDRIASTRVRPASDGSTTV